MRESDDDNNDDDYNYDECLDYSRISITIIHSSKLDGLMLILE
jgi:hypothetical protein